MIGVSCVVKMEMNWHNLNIKFDGTIRSLKATKIWNKLCFGTRIMYVMMFETKVKFGNLDKYLVLKDKYIDYHSSITQIHVMILETNESLTPDGINIKRYLDLWRLRFTGIRAFAQPNNLNYPLATRL